MDDMKLNKVATIERCIKRIREEYADDEKGLKGPFSFIAYQSAYSAKRRNRCPFIGIE